MCVCMLLCHSRLWIVMSPIEVMDKKQQNKTHRNKYIHQPKLESDWYVRQMYS